MKTTTIKLGPRDCALVIRADGEQEMSLPKLDPEAQSPANVILIGMAAAAINDPTLNKIVMEWFEREVENGPA